jgi:tRNA (cytidine56-2'-O)-methyltransferase
MQRIGVLRWGHRARDERLTSHIALAARALGASEFYLSDIVDKKIRETIDKVVKRWGGKFYFEMGKPWKEIIEKWKLEGGIIVHLTAYGENIQSSKILKKIKATNRKILIVVGSQRVPAEFFSEKVSDFNVAIGNQPHSECSSLAVFLDRIFDGEELTKEFEGAELRIIPQVRGKKTINPHANSN